MLGAQRHIEARIGQLLGPAPGQGSRNDLTSHHDEKSIIPHDEDRAAFRILARALDGECELTPDEWRKMFREATTGNAEGRRRKIVITSRIRMAVAIRAPTPWPASSAYRAPPARLAPIAQSPRAAPRPPAGREKRVHGRLTVAKALSPSQLHVRCVASPRYRNAFNRPGPIGKCEKLFSSYAYRLGPLDPHHAGRPGRTLDGPTHSQKLL
jgi:hypothetical protein